MSESTRASRIAIDEEAFELTDRNNVVESPEIQSLPRADGGRAAWTTLGACFCLEAVVWGFPFSFGVFQEYYSTHEPFRGQPAGVAAISTTLLSIMYFGSPAVALTIQRFPGVRRSLGFIGLAIMIAALIGSSFVESVLPLLATQGILYAVGATMLYYPALSIVDEWFIAKKGLALAIMWSGTYSGGTAVPFLCQGLLDKYGFRTALRVWAIILTTIAIPAVMLMRPRITVTRPSKRRPMDFSFLAQARFWIYSIPSIVQSIVCFLPLVWLPSFATAVGLPQYAGTVAIALTNLSVCAGYLIQGRLGDRFPASFSIAIATIGGMISVFVFWGLATNQAMLYLFAITWGLTGASYPASWVGSANDMRRKCRDLDTTLVISLMNLGKGLGSVSSGPISAALLSATPSKDLGFAYGTEYGWLIMLTGVGVTLGGTGCIARLFVTSK